MTVRCRPAMWATKFITDRRLSYNKMKSIFHFLIRSADPKVGGMEHSIVRIAGHLAGLPGAIVRIYALNDDEKSLANIYGDNVEIIYLKTWKNFLMQSLEVAGASDRHA